MEDNDGLIGMILVGLMLLSVIIEAFWRAL